VRKGYRPVKIALATNLMDAKLWPPEKIMELYGLRWGIENDIRDMKLRHGLAMLSCKSPDIVRKEIWSGLLAYSCVKLLLGRTGKDPRRLSHKRACAVILQWSAKMAWALTTCLPMLSRQLIMRLSGLTLRRQERPPCPRALVRNTQADYPFLYHTRQQWYVHYLAAA
ncbi:MAG: transposase, partial [Planctomycetes bacterium]|nr:transposase [Planctomycetota bacterium]